MSKLRTRGVAVLCVLCVLHAVPCSAEEGLDTALAGVRAEALGAHMRFLADDLLEGREAGTRGYQLAALYVASHFEQIGLQPAGDDGGWVQMLDLRRSVQVQEGCSFVLSRDDTTRTLEYGVDYFMIGDTAHTETDVEAPLVYVGYGVSAPELDHDDFAGIDVKGRILVVLRGAPPTFPHNQRAYHAREKDAAMEKKGAVGVISILQPEEAAKRPWDRRLQNSSIARMRLLDAAGKPLDAHPGLRARASLSDAGIDKLFAGAARTKEQVFEAAAAGRSDSFELPYRARIKRQSQHRNVRSRNVVAMLPGSDPQLRDEFIVYSGHLDHLGVGASDGGDTIYNGAIDNASGIAVMIETARAFRSLPQAPRRSLLFLAVTAEEKGLLGSRHFAESPTVPLDGIIANINLDMFLMLHPMKDVVAFGAEHTSLGETVRQAAAQMGVEVCPDPTPEEVIFVRSDQYSFVRKGVPAVFLTAGSGGQEEDGPSNADWLRQRYHSQSDDMDQPMVLQAGVDFTRLNIRIGFAVAHAPERPHWLDGDFFGEKFGR